MTKATTTQSLADINQYLLDLAADFQNRITAAEVEYGRGSGQPYVSLGIPAMKHVSRGLVTATEGYAKLKEACARLDKCLGFPDVYPQSGETFKSVVVYIERPYADSTDALIDKGIIAQGEIDAPKVYVRKLVAQRKAAQESVEVKQEAAQKSWLQRHFGRGKTVAASKAAPVKKTGIARQL